jgi:transposase
LLKFLLRHGRIWCETKNWTERHWAWLRAQRFEEASAQRTFDEHLAQLDFGIDRLRALDAEIARVADEEPWKLLVGRLRCLHGIDTLSAMTLLAEVQDFRRFRSPKELMSFLGLVPSIHASGGSEYRGSITKSGNGHARRILVEAAWHYRHRPMMAGRLRERAEGQPEFVRAEAMKAQHRLHLRYRRLVARGKPPHVAVVVIARELCGFVWALLVKHEQQPEVTSRAARARGRAAREEASREGTWDGWDTGRAGPRMESPRLHCAAPGSGLGGPRPQSEAAPDEPQSCGSAPRSNPG